MATFTVGRTSEKFIQRVQQNDASTKRLVERLCDIKISLPFLELGYVGSISAADEATLKAEAHALTVYYRRSHTMPFTQTYYVLVPCVALLPDLVGTCSVSLVARCRTAPPARTRSAKAFKRSRQLESMTFL